MMSTANAPVPVTIISGFLGAGKTTLLRRVLDEPGGRRLGVLVNDFGALNVDAELISEVKADVVALTNGCICCSIRDDLVGAAVRLLESGPLPDHILVETSGVSNPASVADAFFASELTGRLTVHGIFCLIDLENFPDLDHSATELAIDQAAVADIVLANKCDLVASSDVAEFERTLQEALPKPRILRTVRAEVPTDLLFDLAADRLPGAGAPDPGDGRHDHSTHRHDAKHRHDNSFASWSWRSHRPLDLDAFRDAVANMPTGIFRSKGVLLFADRRGEKAVFQSVGKRASLDFTPYDEAGAVSTLVAIGAAGTFEPAELDRMFEQCIA